MRLDYDAQLAKALSAAAPRFSLNDNLRSFESLQNASALLFLIIHEKERKQKEPLMDYEDLEIVRTEIYRKVKYIIKGGNEPCFDLGPCWGYLPLCCSLALIHNDRSLWNLFTEEEHIRITQLMKMFTYLWNLGCNTDNNYGTGPSMKGNYGKWRGPNYRLTNYGLIFGCINFFGGIDEINKILLAFDYETELDALNRLGFTNAYNCWATSGVKEMTMHGGDVYIQVTEYGATNTYKRGTGKGVRIPMQTKDSYPHGLVYFLLNNCYSGGLCTNRVQINNDISVGLPEGVSSPYLGRDGMMLEFDLENDGLGRRSSSMHCCIDFILSVCLTATLWHLRITKLKVRNEYPKVWVGNMDCIFKLENGYKGWSLDFPENFDYSKFLGFELWSNYWRDHNQNDPSLSR